MRKNDLPRTTSLEVSRICHVPQSLCFHVTPTPSSLLPPSHVPRALLKLPDADTKYHIITVYLHICLTWNTASFPEARQGQTSLYGPTLSTATGTEKPAPSELQPSDFPLPLPHTPEPAGLLLSVASPQHELSPAPAVQKGQAPLAAHNGPFDSAGCALSGKTRSLPRHLSLKSTQSQCSSGSKGRGREAD